VDEVHPEADRLCNKPPAVFMFASHWPCFDHQASGPSGHAMRSLSATLVMGVLGAKPLTPWPGSPGPLEIIRIRATFPACRASAGEGPPRGGDGPRLPVKAGREPSSLAVRVGSQIRWPSIACTLTARKALPGYPVGTQWTAILRAAARCVALRFGVAA
jgi:hypothetical protein